MQSSKQRWTMLEYIYKHRKCSATLVKTQEDGDDAYGHELFHLLPLHTLSKLLLLLGIEPARTSVWRRAIPLIQDTHESMTT